MACNSNVSAKLKPQKKLGYDQFALFGLKLCFLLFMKRSVILINLRYAIDMLHSQQVPVIARNRYISYVRIYFFQRAQYRHASILVLLDIIER